MDYIYSYKESNGQLDLTVSQPGTNQVVFLQHYPTFYEEAITGILIEDGTLISYGIMKNLDDISGLEGYLKKQGIIGQEDKLITAKEFKEGGCACQYEEGGATSKKEETPVPPRLVPSIGEQRIEEQGFGANISDLPYEPSKFLSAEHQVIERRFGEQLFTDYEAQKKEYIKRFGKIINTDNARELSEDYRNNKQELSSAVHEPASAFVKMLYADLLKEKPESEYVLFTAGGTGSGKTTAINKLPATKYLSDNADIVYDSNMNNTPSAAKKMDQALLSGRRAVVIFVYRDPIEAFENGVIPRSTRSGRTVPIYEHVNTHIGSVVSIGELMEKYKDNPRVVFEIIDNSFGKDKSKLSTLANVEKKAYLAPDELKNTLYEINEQKWKNGKIGQGQYNGFAQGKVFEQGGSAQNANAGAGGVHSQNHGYEPEQPGSSRQEQLAYGGSPYAGTNAMPELLADEVATRAVNSNILTKNKSTDEKASIAVTLTDQLIQKANYMYRNSPVFRISLNGTSPTHGRNKLEEYMEYWAKLFINKGMYKNGGSITRMQDAILSEEVPDIDEQDMVYAAGDEVVRYLAKGGDVSIDDSFVVGSDLILKYAKDNNISYKVEFNKWQKKNQIVFTGTAKEFFKQKKQGLFSQITHPSGFNETIRRKRV